MKSSATMQEILGKNQKELQHILAEERERLRTLRFQESQSHLRSIRSIRQTRLSIARILTAMNKARKKVGLPK